MRDSRRTVLGGALGVLLGVLATHPLGAQLPIPDLRAQPTAPARGLPRPTAIESQFTRVRLDGTARGAADGFGLRLVYGRPQVDDASSLAARTELALFATHTPRQRLQRDARVESTTLGVAADVRPLGMPTAGRLDPFASVGAGLLRTATSALATTPLVRLGEAPIVRLEPSRVERTRTAAALVPGIGVRLLLNRRVALQADARDVIALGHDARHNVVVGTGLRFAL